MEKFRPRMDVKKAMNILKFSSSTKLSDISYEALQDKFSQRMEKLEEEGGEARKPRRTEGREKGQGKHQVNKDNVDVRVLHEAYQFLNQKLKSTETSEDKKK